jgi:hypothetical protein
MEMRMRRFHGEVRASGAALELLHESVARIDDKLERCRALAARASGGSEGATGRARLGSAGRRELAAGGSSGKTDPEVGERGSRA